MSIQVIYETDHISLLYDSTMPNILNYHIRRIMSGKKKLLIWEISIILIYQKFGSVGPIQQKIMLPLPNKFFSPKYNYFVNILSMFC